MVLCPNWANSDESLVVLEDFNGNVSPGIPAHCCRDVEIGLISLHEKTVELACHIPRKHVHRSANI